MVDSDCQCDRICNHLRNKPLGTSVKNFLGWLVEVERLNLKVGCVVLLVGCPGLHRKEKVRSAPHIGNHSHSLSFSLSLSLSFSLFLCPLSLSLSLSLPNCGCHTAICFISCYHDFPTVMGTRQKGELRQTNTDALWLWDSQGSPVTTRETRTGQWCSSCRRMWEARDPASAE